MCTGKQNVSEFNSLFSCPKFFHETVKISARDVDEQILEMSRVQESPVVMPRMPYNRRNGGAKGAKGRSPCNIETEGGSIFSPPPASFSLIMRGLYT